MSYLGATPLTSEYYYDTFTGDGSTTGFVTTIAPASPVSVIVTIDGNIVDPGVYFFEENNIHFLTAPDDTKIIQLRYLAVPSSGVAAPYTYRQVDEFVATEGQDTFNIRYYDLGYIDVYLNGSQLGNADYQASDGATVILQTAAHQGDLVRIVSAYNTVLTRSTLNATPNTVIIGNGLDSHQEIYPGTSGNVLTSNGTNWISSSTIDGSISITQNLNVTGNLIVSGTSTTIDTNNLVVEDSLIYLANNNTANVIDIGFVGNYTDTKYQHSGLVRDASDGKWKLFSNVATEPTTTVNFNNANYDTLKVGIIEANTATINGVNLGTYTQSAFDQANTAVNNGSSASTYANTGINNAASASSYANTAINNAASASSYANTAINNAASASSYANTANNNAASASLYANTANNNAASASLYANTRPQNSQTANTYVLALTDQGKHLYWPNSFGGNVSIYIPNNGQVSWTIGTEIKIISKVTTANLILTPNTSVNLYLAGNTTSASRNVNTYGVATIINTAANTWFMTGFGIGN